MNKFTLLNSYRSPMSSMEVLRLIGFPSGRCPEEGAEEFVTLNGVSIWIKSLAPITDANRARRGKSRRDQRLMARCPCGWTGAYGRLRQHVCKVPRYSNPMDGADEPGCIGDEQS